MQCHEEALGATEDCDHKDSTLLIVLHSVMLCLAFILHAFIYSMLKLMVICSWLDDLIGQVKAQSSSVYTTSYSLGCTKAWCILELGDWTRSQLWEQWTFIWQMHDPYETTYSLVTEPSSLFFSVISLSSAKPFRNQWTAAQQNCSKSQGYGSHWHPHGIHHILQFEVKCFQTHCINTSQA